MKGKNIPRTTPVKDLINREISEEKRELFNWFSSILEEAVNFGSHIIVWDSDPNREGEEHLAPVTLLRHYLDILDSLSVIAKVGSADAMKIPARALMETCLYLDFIFQKDTLKRSLCFYVGSVRRLIRRNMAGIKESGQAKQFNALLKKENVQIKISEETYEEVKRGILEKQELLKGRKFRDICKEFEKLEEKRKTKKIEWFSLFDGPDSIEKLALTVRQGTLYEIMYRNWSGYVHGSDTIFGRLLYNEETGSADLLQIRLPKDIRFMVEISLAMTFRVFRTYTSKRIPHKFEDYSRWYLSMLTVKAELNEMDDIS